MLTHAQAIAFHEAGHAAVARLRGVRVTAVGLTAGGGGICELDQRDRTGTLASAVSDMVIWAAGPVAQNMAGGRYQAADSPAEDFRAIAGFRRQALRLAPPGWRPADPKALARRALAGPVTWAGVVHLARAIAARGGMVDGAAAAAALTAGGRDRPLVDRILMGGTRAVW